MFSEFLEWAADNAVAAAVYVFTLCRYNLRNGIFLGVNTPENSDSITSLSGAYLGRLKSLKNKIESYESDENSYLENKKDIIMRIREMIKLVGHDKR